MTSNGGRNEMLYVANDGLVLLNPFLPRLFERLGVLSQADGRPVLVGPAASRTVRLLQYVATGQADAPEASLPLNKLLCGLSPDQPLDDDPEPSPADRALGDEVLAAVIANWPAVRNTSVAGLRETFLQREGRLDYRQGPSTLEAERKMVDVLVDQIPWSFSVVLHPWMAEPLHVTW